MIFENKMILKTKTYLPTSSFLTRFFTYFHILAPSGLWMKKQITVLSFSCDLMELRMHLYAILMKNDHHSSGNWPFKREFFSNHFDLAEIITSFYSFENSSISLNIRLKMFKIVSMNCNFCVNWKNCLKYSKMLIIKGKIRFSYHHSFHNIYLKNHIYIATSRYATLLVNYTVTIMIFEEKIIC